MVKFLDFIPHLPGLIIPNGERKEPGQEGCSESDWAGIPPYPARFDIVIVGAGFIPAHIYRVPPTCLAATSPLNSFFPLDICGMNRVEVEITEPITGRGSNRFWNRVML
jgi:hypothetical protein